MTSLLLALALAASIYPIGASVALPSATSAVASAASSASNTAQASVPQDSGTVSGHPVAGTVYDGPLRPQIHFSPPHGFMNDPNGLFRDANGTWHLYYQYNPVAIVAGNQHWGHATSDDLYHWSNEAPALAPPAPGVGVFSGSAVIDVNNTSGLFKGTGGVIAIYTLDYAAGTWANNGSGTEGNVSAPREVQCLAYSTDGGYTFTPYEGNPVLDLGSPAFRDPKVIRVDNTWLMAVALADEHVVQFYKSSDLIHWSLSSNFSVNLGKVQWECPNLVPIDGAWVLILSTNPGGMWGGSTTVYWTGEWNGTHFIADLANTGEDGEVMTASPGMSALLATPADDRQVGGPYPKSVEWGPDAYAGQVFYPDDVEAVYMPWANNWAYVQQTPTDTEGWRGAMGLPRSLHLDGHSLIQVPHGLDTVRRQTAIGAKSVNGSMAWTYDTGLYRASTGPAGGGGAAALTTDVLNGTASEGSGNSTASQEANGITASPLLLQINITGLSGDLGYASINWSFFSADAEFWLESGYMPRSGELWTSRALVGAPRGSHEDNTAASSQWPPIANYTTHINTTYYAGGAMSITAVLDASLLETFVDGGRSVATLAVYPAAPLTRVGVWAALPSLAHVTATVTRLQSVWSA